MRNMFKEYTQDPNSFATLKQTMHLTTFTLCSYIGHKFKFKACNINASKLVNNYQTITWNIIQNFKRFWKYIHNKKMKKLKSSLLEIKF